MKRTSSDWHSRDGRGSSRPIVEAAEATAERNHAWRFVTNHAHVLETIARDSTARLRDIAATVGITERTAAQIVRTWRKPVT